MSRANLYVRYPDGTVRYGIYNGTSDVCLPFIVGDPDEAWRKYEEDEYDWEAREDTEVIEPVTIATDYGAGWAWIGRATLNRLVEGFDPFDGQTAIMPLPEWVI